MSYAIVDRYYESNRPALVGTMILRYDGMVGGLMRRWHLAELDDNNNIVRENFSKGNDDMRLQQQRKLEIWKEGQSVKNERIAKGLPLH